MPAPLRIDGKQRTAQNLDTVDNIEGGSVHPAAAAAQTPAASTPKPHPASYAPSGDTGPRVYGAPISTPILK